MKKVAEQVEQEQVEQAQPEQKAATSLTISIEDANQLFNYLASKPFAEVADIIKKLQGSQFN
jgi:hypothetical protein